MAMAGHSNVETTMRYYAVATEDQINRVREASETAIRTVISHETDAGMTQEAPSSSRLSDETKCK